MWLSPAPGLIEGDADRAACVVRDLSGSSSRPGKGRRPNRRRLENCFTGFSGNMPPSRSAIHRVDRYYSQKVNAAMAIGAPIKAANRLQTKVQKKTARGLVGTS
jgi:hypothetical protein